MTLPLVSIITATHNRHEQLMQAMLSVNCQTFRDFEHLIIADGPDDLLAELVESARQHAAEQHAGGRQRHFIELGRNWHNPACGPEGGLGAIPRMVGTYLARGKYIAYLDDDNEWLPDHLEMLVFGIEANGGVDLAYSKYQKFVDGKPNGETCPGPGKGGVPARGDIDTNIILHRSDLIQKANWRGDVPADDWQLVSDWLEAGATFRWIDKITCVYHAWH